jgi:hypothetical protein
MLDAKLAITSSRSSITLCFEEGTRVCGLCETFIAIELFFVRGISDAQER